MAQGPFDTPKQGTGEGGSIKNYGSLMTMRGPHDRMTRRQLLPGMLLADGSIYTGHLRLTGILTEQETLKTQIVTLQARFNALEEEREAIEAALLKEAEGPAPSEEETPAKKPTGKRKATKK